MSAPVDRITAVHLAHRVRVAPIRSWPHTFRCSCGDWSVQAEDGEEQGCAHVAERIAAELQPDVDAVAEAMADADDGIIFALLTPDEAEFYRRMARAALLMSAWSAVEEKP